MNRIGTLYGQGLYALAREEGLEADILQQLQTLEEAFSQEPTFLKLLSSANVPKQDRTQILDESFREKVHIYVLNFLKILTEKGYMRHFSDCRKAYEESFNRDNGILPVTAFTAVPLSSDQADKLTDKLSRITGKQIKLHSRIDPTVLGGVRLDYDGKRLDDTVSHRLDSIRDLLKNTVL